MSSEIQKLGYTNKYVIHDKWSIKNQSNHTKPSKRPTGTFLCQKISRENGLVMVDILVCLGLRQHALTHLLKQAHNQASMQVCNQASTQSIKSTINQEHDQSSARSIKRAINQARDQSSARSSKRAIKQVCDQASARSSNRAIKQTRDQASSR